MDRIAILDRRFTLLAGWRRRLALMALGAIAALALPPVGLVPALFLTLPPMLWALDRAETRKAAFGAGWWWAMGWYSAGFYWLSNALLTDVARFGWMIPFVIFGLSGLVAAFVAIATLATHLTGWRGPGRLFALAAFWTIGEWLRSWVLTGFPWNPIGSVWDSVPAVLQFGSVVGVWGLCLMTALAALAPALLTAGHGRLVAVLTLGLPLAAGLGGEIRLIAAPDPAQAVVPGQRVRLVQASLSQANKWADGQREANLAEHVALSRQPGFDALSLVIWPETAVSFFLDLDTLHREQAAAAAPLGGHLITGMPRVTPRGVEPFQVWNSMVAINADARTEATYDKAHLVPFGEYVPLRGLLPIAKITHGGTDFSAGPGPATLEVPGLPPFSPLICYEALFPRQVVAPDGPRPHWLLAITNDGWFGQSAGPYQHLAAARLRAIEEGLPLVRAANTGISAVMDPYGRELARIDLGAKGVVDAPLPLAIDPTPYARWGNLIPLALILGSLLFGFLSRRLN
jgi:apolipoprotein N-acyltransferase